MRNAVILAAAGSGSRLGGEPKQIRCLQGAPVFLWSLWACSGSVDEAVIVSSPELQDQMASILAEAQLPYPWRLVLGGQQRVESVCKGLAALSPGLEGVLVHDAARPLLRPAFVQACCQALLSAEAVVLAQPCYATIKRCRQDLIQATVDRRDLWLAQTPQAFRRSLGEPIFRRLQEQSAEIQEQMTDDMAVLEWGGIQARVLQGDPQNIKITTQDDWEQAEAILAWRNRTKGPPLAQQGQKDMV